MQIRKLSIVIPAYNEAATIHLILDKVQTVQLMNDIEKEVIVVNDCSTDDTHGAIERYQQQHPDLNIQYFRHSVNRGERGGVAHGNPPRHGRLPHHSGCRFGIRPAGIQPVAETDVGRVCGCGVWIAVYGRQTAPHFVFLADHRQSFSHLFIQLFYRFNLTDMETCYKLFRTDLIQRLKLRENRFGFEPEVTSQNCPNQRHSDLRSGHFVLWARLRRREKNRVERWSSGDLLYFEV